VAEARVHPAHQARSRQTERAIAEALSALLREKPFPDIRVAEIARRAGVSVGGFYARYRSKEALLETVEVAILEEFTATAADRLSNPGSTIGEIALAYASLLVTNFRAHRAEILQILRYIQNNAGSQERVRQFNAVVHDRMRMLLDGRAPGRSVNLALFFAGAAAREAILMGNIRMYPVELNDEELAREIARAFEAYLTDA